MLHLNYSSTKTRGFSLVEVMVSLALFGMLAISLLGLTLHLRKLSENLVYREHALRTAQNFAEQIKALSYTSVTDAVTTDASFTLKQPKLLSSDLVKFRDVSIRVSDNSNRWSTINVPIKEHGTDNADANSMLSFRIRAQALDGLDATEELEVYEIDLYYEYKKATDTSAWIPEKLRVLIVNEAPSN